MKRFQKEARGLVPGTPEHTAVRNKIYSELRAEKYLENKQVHVQGSGAAALTPEFSSFYALLVVIAESTESYETMHILKFFDFPINVEEDNIIRS